jgi:hypothetical protein
MKTKDAIKIYSAYLYNNTRPNTIRSGAIEGEEASRWVEHLSR